MGRFNNTDALSEASFSYTPYRYGFNNPVYWTDPTGLFESAELAASYAHNTLGISSAQYTISGNDKWGYELHVFDGVFAGQSFYDGTFLEELPELTIDKRGAGGVSGGTSLNNINWAQVNKDVASFGMANTVKTELIELAGKSGELTKTTSSYLKVFKGVGYIGAGVNTVHAGIQLVENPTAGNATRLAVQGVTIGAAFIPGVGWAISLGIGTADMIWGDQFYEWIDNQ